MQLIVSQHLKEIKEAMHHYGVESAYLFGSAVKGTMKAGSDIDFIISFPKDMHYITYADNYFALANKLEDILQTKVELVTEKTLTNPYLLHSINQNKLQLI